MTLTALKEPINIRYLNSNTLKELQQMLFELGYQLRVDGIFGEETREVFYQFKKDYKLTQPDYIGKTTVDLLLKLYKDADLIENEDKHPSQPKFTTPRQVSDINWNDFDSPISKWFTVGEVFRFDSLRVTRDETILKRVINLAKELDKIRDEWGSPIGVTSWYRPAYVNRRVGGVANSRHLFGDAVDIYPINGQIVGFQAWVDKSWHGALGYGSAKGFVHCDCRNGKGWKTGGTKDVRWNY